MFHKFLGQNFIKTFQKRTKLHHLKKFLGTARPRTLGRLHGYNLSIFYQNIPQITPFKNIPW